jgi:hypothetical protein
VRDDHDGRVDLGVEVDEQLRDVAGAHRVEAGVRLVDEDDLRVEDQRAGETRAFAHAAGDLAGQFLLRACEADHVHLVGDDRADLGLGLLRVLAQREGDVVEEVHRAEQRAVLEEDAEEFAGFVELVLTAAHQVDTIDDDAAGVRFQQADQTFQEHGFPGAGRTEHDAHLAGRESQRDVLPDSLLPERLREVLDDDLDSQHAPPPGLSTGEYATTGVVGRQQSHGFSEIADNNYRRICRDVRKTGLLRRSAHSDERNGVHPVDLTVGEQGREALPDARKDALG